jgi:hypothetical protein
MSTRIARRDSDVNLDAASGKPRWYYQGVPMKAPLTMEPGPLGGVLTDMALAGGTVYVATNNVPVTLNSLSSPSAEKGGGSSSGEVEGLSLATAQLVTCTVP